MCITEHQLTNIVGGLRSRKQMKEMRRDRRKHTLQVWPSRLPQSHGWTCMRKYLDNIMVSRFHDAYSTPFAKGEEERRFSGFLAEVLDCIRHSCVFYWIEWMSGYDERKQNSLPTTPSLTISSKGTGMKLNRGWEKWSLVIHLRNCHICARWWATPRGKV